jgi:nitrate/TMAO reductase-like tetraheme cytochrome c subunit
MIAFAFAFQPVTRNFVAQDATCNYCHLPWEFNADFRLSASRPHLADPEEKTSQARCVDCHLPKGWLNTAYAYTHFLSFTDLYGYVRDLDAERAGDWIPPRAATAYRVRNRMYENDGDTCRTCHVESEIKFTRERGVNAHKLALEENKTCIECHNNLVHRPVDMRKNAFKKIDPADG